MKHPSDKKTDPKIQDLAQYLYTSQYPVFFTGAGISTESGLPDFRGPNGVWTRRDKGLPPRSTAASWDSVEPNQGETPFDSQAHLRFYEGIGEILPRAVKRLKKLMGLFE